MHVDRPSPFFPKRNSTRVVLKSRNNISRTSPKPATTTTTTTTTPATTTTAKVTRKSFRRKITRTPNVTKRVQTTTKAYEQFSEELDDEVASILPALTSARPRQSVQSLPRLPTTRQLTIETSTDVLQNLQRNEIEDFQQIQQNNPSSFDEILKQQYKIKGIDVTSEENYGEDERLIGVLGSQVKVILHSLSNDPESVQVECLDAGNYPHPLSCVRYVQCLKIRGNVYQGNMFTCAEGLSFDPASGICSRAQNGCTRNNVRLMNH